MFIAIVNDAGLTYVAEAETPLEAIRDFNEDVGIDPTDAGLRAVSRELTFYRVSDEDAASLENGDIAWGDVDADPLGTPDFETADEIADMTVAWMQEHSESEGAYATAWGDTAAEAAVHALDVFREGEPWSHELKDSVFLDAITTAIASRISGEFEKDVA